MKYNGGIKIILLEKKNLGGREDDLKEVGENKTITKSYTITQIAIIIFKEESNIFVNGYDSSY